MPLWLLLPFVRRSLALWLLIRATLGFALFALHRFIYPVDPLTLCLVVVLSVLLSLVQVLRQHERAFLGFLGLDIRDIAFIAGSTAFVAELGVLAFLRLPYST